MIKLVRLVIAVCLASTLHFTAASQSLSINTTGATADPSAILDVTSATKGVLIPRMDKTQKNAIATPATGLLIYQTMPDSTGFHYYDGTQWVWLSGTSDSTAWKITGNSNITSANFLGTINDTALRFRVKDIPSGLLDSASANTTLGFRSNAGLTTGLNNTFMGFRAGVLNDTTSNNTFVGFYAGERNRNSNNVAVGAQAGRFYSFNNQSTTEMTSVGTEASHGAFVNPKSTAVGFRALYSRQGNALHGNTIGRNTAVGDSAMAWAGFGQSNVAVGTEALATVDNGNFNIAIGDSSLAGALNTNGNVAIGYKTLSKQQAQGWNTAVGYYSQRDSSKSTYYNTSIGAYSMEFNRTGVYNTGLGLSSLRLTDSASYNTAVGADAMYFHRKNGSNLAAGAFAMRGDSAGYWNTAVGSEAMDRYGADGSARGTGFSNVAVGFRALRGAREAFENTAVGVGALESDSSGNYNTAVGRYSSFLNKRGDFNVSLGFRASNNADTASFTTAIGSYAGAKNKQDNNVTIGYAAGYEAGAVGGYDPKEITFVGYEAGRGAWASNKNTSLGFRALSNTDAGFGFYDYVNGRNTAIGDSAMAFSIGASNVVVGAEALSNSGVNGTWNNVAIGDSAMGAALSNGGALADNVAIGYRSLTRVKNQGNVAVGAYAGNELANTIWNTAVGYHALENDSTGNENTAMGTSALRGNYNGIRNVGVGINSGYNVTSSNNTYLGSYAGEGVFGLSTGGLNTGVGYQVLQSIRSGANNTAVGYRAMNNDSTGSLNTAVGNGALFSNTQSNVNQAFGYNALFSFNGGVGDTYNNAFGDRAAEGLITGTQNVVMGSWAFLSHTSGSFNTAIGNYAMGGGAGGSNNTALGASALSITNASGNTGIGYNAGTNNTTGTNNTIIGNLANVASSGLTNATAIGTQALASQSNSMVLGSIAGLDGASNSVNVGIGETTPNARLHITRNGSSGGTYNASSELIVEDNASSYITLSNPNASENGFLSGNASTSIKGGIIFQADSSIQIRAGGNFTRMTVDNNGFVGIGTTAPNYQLELTTNSAGKPASGTWTISSDNRLKNINGDYTKGLAEILKLNTIKYNYTASNTCNLPTDKQAYGFSAQEVQKVFPEAVKTGRNGYLNLNLHPVFIS
ncbi:MAG: tail fiber domain-containing protein [Chitinophagaceae bacterium]|nr:tail fiber domain-containing protein [Chitinophagaceae bacterium]